MIKVTVRDAIAAIEKNGLRKATGVYIIYDYYGDIVAGCAIGQGAINLGSTVSPSSLEWEINKVLFPRGIVGISYRLDRWPVGDFQWFSSVSSLNDHTDLEIREIAKLLHQRAKEFGVLDEIIAIESGE